jgi:hypothetical protein
MRFFIAPQYGQPRSRVRQDVSDRLLSVTDMALPR